MLIIDEVVMIATYILTLPNADNNYYIGSTEDFDKRFNEHIRYLNKKTHHNKAFQAAWDKSPGLVMIETEEHETLTLARIREQELIQERIDDPKMMNIGLHTNGGDNLTRHPERERIIKQIKETIDALVAGMTDEERKLRFARYGDKNGMYGRKHSDESRQQMSKSRRGKYTGVNSSRWNQTVSDETKAKLSAIASRRTGNKNSFYGKVHSEETKRRIATAKAGNIPANARPVSIDGVIYNSATEAGRVLQIPTVTILFRIKSKNPKFVAYAFAK